MKERVLVDNKRNAPSKGVSSIRRVLREEIDSEKLGEILKKCAERTDLWVLRGVLGADLPSPMTFEMLKNYAKETGKGDYSLQDLQKLFLEQVDKV